MTAQPCDSRLTLGEQTDELWLACKCAMGHGGMHFADVRLNGVDCETGWRDADEGVWRVSDHAWPRDKEYVGAMCDCCERNDVPVVTWNDDTGTTVCEDCYVAMRDAA